MVTAARPSTVSQGILLAGVIGLGLPACGSATLLNADGGAGRSGSGGAAGAWATGGATGSGGGGATGTGGGGTAGATGTGGNTGTGGSSSGANLIVNGDFSQGVIDWGIPNGIPISSGVNNGEFCVTLGASSGQVVVGWGGTSVSASLAADVNYQLSYQASTTSSLSSFDVHVGQVVNPYHQDYPSNGQPIGDSPQTGLTIFTHTFSLPAADPQAGVAFLFAASTGTPTVCFGNVSLTQN